jgi:hypothetical protein
VEAVDTRSQLFVESFPEHDGWLDLGGNCVYVDLKEGFLSFTSRSTHFS